MTDQWSPGGGPGGMANEEEDLLGTELRVLLATLPADLAPERDLLPEIAARTWEAPAGRSTAGVAEQTGATATDTARKRIAWWKRPAPRLAAAAVALVVVTASVTTYVVRGPRSDGDVATTVAPTADISGVSPASVSYRFAGYERVEREYARAIADLTAALEAERDRLSPETVRLIEENLRVIDAAIEQSLAALQEAPQSLSLQQAVMTSYETKLDFLRRAAAITADG